jgi:phosphopantothenoylcysteine decarboxylase/phosphopantothenate--cysteine ligase
MDYINNLLTNKKVALFVTGSIAIYKSLELIRLFVKSGADIRVVMSDNATKFISPLTFEALSKYPPLTSNSESWSNENNHIDIGKWADIAVIAPASANTINSLANGLANSVFLSSLLAFDKTKIVAIGTNTKMYNNHITQSSIKFLKISKYKFISPTTKTLICNDTGVGAMADIEDIFFTTTRELIKNKYFEYRKAVVTGGGSIESIDDIRFISNYSSGKMGYYISLALYLKGADVCFINSKDIKSNLFHTIDAKSSKEIYEYLQQSIKYAKEPTIIKPDLDNELTQPISINKTPFLFMASAISDYIPKHPQQGKLKKEILGDEYKLELIKNIDILKNIDKNALYSIGFKAEMDKDNALNNATNMLNDKNLDAVVLNILNDKNSFGSEETQTTLITKENTINLNKNHKLQNTFNLLDIFMQNDKFN